MLLIYTPDGGEKREWTFKPTKLMSVEAEAIERATGWSYGEFGENFLKGSVLAKRAALWVLRKREESTLRFGEVQFAVDEVSVLWDSDEKADIRTALAETPDLDEEQRDVLLRSLGSDEEEAAAEAPKAKSRKATSTPPSD